MLTLSKGEFSLLLKFHVRTDVNLAGLRTQISSKRCVEQRSLDITAFYFYVSRSYVVCYFVYVRIKVSPMYIYTDVKLVTRQWKSTFRFHYEKILQ